MKKNIISLSKKHQKPFYVYDTKSIRKVCESFKAINYENKLIVFATMANSSEEFLRLIKSEGLSVFVNSIQHLKKCLELGFDGRDIVYTSSAMSEEDMIEVNRNHCILNLDSLGQLRRWNNLFPGTMVGIRCNIGDSKSKKTRAGYFLGDKSRLGLNLEEILSLEGATYINGLHLYPGTDILDINYFEECYRKVIELSRLFPNLEYLDFGGGFGVGNGDGKNFDMKRYNSMISRLMNKVSVDLNKSIRLIIEPGRILGSKSGYFVTRVNDIKMRKNHQFIGLNASSVQFPRPLMYPEDAYHPITLVNKRNGKLFNSSVYGCSTYSRDYFSRNVRLPRLKEGDVIIFGNAGSYCSSMFTQFLGFEKPEEIFI